MAQATRKRPAATRGASKAAATTRGKAGKKAGGKATSKAGGKAGGKAAATSNGRTVAGRKPASRVASRKAVSTRAAPARAAGTRAGSRAAAPRERSAERQRTLATATLANSAAIGQMARLLREVAAIACVFGALIGFLALASFHADDPGWSHTGVGGDVRNSVGRAGAWFADVTFYLLGFMAYLVPLLLAASAWLLFTDRRRSPRAYRPFVFVRVIGVALMLAAATGLADLHFGVTEGALPRGTFGGGVLGTAVAWRLVAYLHHLGTTLLLLALFFASLTLAFGTSWLQLVESIGSAIAAGIERITGLLDGRSDARAEAQRRIEADAARRARFADELPGAHDAIGSGAPPLAIDADRIASGGVRATTGGAGLFARLGTAGRSLRRLLEGPDGPVLAPGGAAASSAASGAFAARHDALDAALDAQLDGSLDEADALLASRRRERATGATGRATGRAAGSASAEGAPAATHAASTDDALGEASARARADAAPAMASAPPVPVARSTSATRAAPAASKAVPQAAPPAVPAPEAPPMPSAAEPGAAPEARKKKIAIRERAHNDERQSKLYLDVPDTDLPPLSLLDKPQPITTGFSEEELRELSLLLEEKLSEFKIEVEVVAVQPGPVITRFEMQLAPGIKASRVTTLSQDIARSLSLTSVRVVEVIPGKSTIGIEVPNQKREMVVLSEMLMSEQFMTQKSSLTLALGKDISGAPVMADIAKMPHLLVAGTTGAGKSVAINSMLISLLYKSTAKDVRLILIDPKVVELNVYDGIPHLLTPVVTDMSEAANALRWCVGEMERRIIVMGALKVRNITGYNKKIRDAEEAGEPLTDPLWDAAMSLNPTGPPPLLEPMPLIVVVVDEFADMMMQVGKKAEELIARIAQKARAAGIHLILATQRPSVDVITGLIKANVPTRIAFKVSTKIDSRTIIDQGGAETLLGHGDMLYQPPGASITQRVHGAFIDDHEVLNVVAHLKTTGEPQYIEAILQEQTAAIPGLSGGEGGDGGEQDALYDQAVAVVCESRRASISFVQRKLKIGYNRAARMIEEMETAGVVTPDINGKREVIAPPPV